MLLRAEISGVILHTFSTGNPGERAGISESPFLVADTHVTVFVLSRSS